MDEWARAQDEIAARVGQFAPADVDPEPTDTPETEDVEPEARRVRILTGMEMKFLTVQLAAGERRDIRWKDPIVVQFPRITFAGRVTKAGLGDDTIEITVDSVRS